MAPRRRKRPTGPATPADAADLTAQAQQGIRQGARRIGSGVLGAAGVSALALLAVSSILPLLGGPVTLATATAWLAGLGAMRWPAGSRAGPSEPAHRRSGKRPTMSGHCSYWRPTWIGTWSAIRPWPTRWPCC